MMHVVGVIIHGHPDRRYFFLAYPHLAGDSNLNVECIRMALVQFAKDTGFVLRPNLYIQIDNASDNKSRFVFGALATMVVLNGLVNQVELVMLPVGHTASLCCAIAFHACVTCEVGTCAGSASGIVGTRCLHSCPDTHLIRLAIAGHRTLHGGTILRTTGDDSNNQPILSANPMSSGTCRSVLRGMVHRA